MLSKGYMEKDIFFIQDWRPLILFEILTFTLYLSSTFK